MKIKLTKRTVEAVEPPQEQNEIVLRDTELKGFQCRIGRSGRRFYRCYARGPQGRILVRLGEHGVVTTEQARKAAREALVTIQRGEDPRKATRDLRAAPTINELAARYLQEHAAPNKAERSLREDRRLLRTYILPALGRLKVTAVEHSEVSQLINSLREKPTTANRIRALLSKMFNLAELWGLRPDNSNPCRHAPRYKENKREYYLTELQLARLAQVLRDSEARGDVHKTALAAIRLLLFTGARSNEILTLRWENIDFEQRLAAVPQSKTGPITIRLNSIALDVLNSLDPDESGWVFPGGRGNPRWQNLQKSWRKIRAAARIEHIRIHDLRHTFASFGVAEQINDFTLRELLNHKSIQTTQRYAHAPSDPLHEASEIIASKIEKAMSSDVRKLSVVK